MNWSKLFPVVVAVVVPIIGANSDVLKQVVADNPTLAIILAGVGAIVGSLAPSPLNGAKKE